mmetsp:Transcript_23014/g.71751  ORF Transcript_23014/g.71751 Transcript_23014/m.71751 type:complete len:288 (-) Transcript_23014:16-879(-)
MKYLLAAVCVPLLAVLSPMLWLLARHLSMYGLEFGVFTLRQALLKEADLDGKILILHVGKAGGTALRQFLRPLLTPAALYLTDGYVMSQQPVRCGYENGRRYAFFVRDPAQRFVSAFISRLREGAPLFRTPHSPAEAWAFGRFPTPEDLACTLSSANPWEAEEARTAMGAIGHVSSSLRDYLGGLANVAACVERESILFVGRLEHYGEDLAQLLLLLGAERAVTAQRPVPAAKVHATPERYRHLELEGCGRENIRRWYRDDYEIIGLLASHGLLPASYLEEIGGLPP